VMLRRFYFVAVACLEPSCQFATGNTECRLIGVAPLSTRSIALLKYRHLSHPPTLRPEITNCNRSKLRLFSHFSRA